MLICSERANAIAIFFYLRRRLSKRKGPFTRTVSVSVTVIVKFTLTERMCSKQSVAIGTMVNFDGEGGGHGHADVTCKQTFIPNYSETL